MEFPTELKVAVVPVSHVFEISTCEDEICYKGFEAEFLKILSKLLNFKFEIVIPHDALWGERDCTGNWSGIIAMLLRGEADLGLSHLDITEHRSEVVDFSVPYDMSDKTFATDYPHPQSRYAVFMYPFSINVWIAILITFIVMFFVLSLLSSRKRMSFKLLIEMFGNLCKQPSNIKKTSFIWKFHFSIWILFVSVITMCYCAVFVSYLSRPLIDKGVTTVGELSKAVKEGSYKCLITSGTHDLHILLESKQQELNIIGKYALNNDWFYNPTVKSVANYLGPHTAVMASRNALMSPDFVEKYVSDDSFGIWYIGIAFRKSFCCKEKLNAAIHRILSTGLFQKYVRDELSIRRRYHVSNQHQRKLNHLQFKDVSDIFIPLIFGQVISIIVLFGEVIIFNLSN